ncbi:MAG: alpha/beta hydrolase [Oligoflexia bacterium]|nr:alpha/beta hydrolase [Oligoflexia bacterium]
MSIKQITTVNILIIISLISSFFFSCSCSNLLYHPNKVEYATPTQFGLDYQDIYFYTKDNVKLHGQIITSSKSANQTQNQNQKKYKGTILFYHGNAENLSSHFMQFVFIVKEGYDLFVFDYRGYGKSEGSPDQLGLYLDSLAALDVAFYQHQSQLQKLQSSQSSQSSQKVQQPLFIIYGQSIGGIVAMKGVMNFHQSKRKSIDLVVMDSTFSSYKDISFDLLKRNLITIVFSPLAYILMPDLTEIKSSLPQVDRPVLVIHGTNDQTVPLKFGQEIYDQINPNVSKWFWTINNGRHIETFFANENIYQGKFLEFLDNLNNIKTLDKSKRIIR